MNRLSGRLCGVGAILAIGVLVGCAEPAPPPRQEAVTMAPQLAGAWYRVYFDSNKADIDDRGRMMIDRAVYVAKSNAAARVSVIGRTDRVGTPAANMTLSQRRADRVRDALIAAGVPADRIDTSWTGEVKQRVATPNDVVERRNRVVDITVVDESS
jgi:peptidoglycan-associated lipoprotein